MSNKQIRNPIHLFPIEGKNCIVPKFAIESSSSKTYLELYYISVNEFL